MIVCLVWGTNALAKNDYENKCLRTDVAEKSGVEPMLANKSHVTCAFLSRLLVHICRVLNNLILVNDNESRILHVVIKIVDDDKRNPKKNYQF